MDIKVINEKGLHARASAKFAEICEASPAKATVMFDGMSADGASIMGLMMLGASKGSVLEVEATGEKAEDLLMDLASLVENYFGEGG